MRQQMAMQQQFENASLQHEANSWTNEKIMEDQHSHAKVSFEEEQKSILNSSSSMLDVMMNDPDPRFQNSEFLGFLKKIQNG
jgi:peroxin-5